MAMRATPGWLGITPLPRPSGERCLSQAGEFACPWASTEFPDLASRRAPPVQQYEYRQHLVLFSALCTSLL